ncbi:hypothetical protein KR215_009575, partial [Drosophila sulfurigaster]
QRAPPPTYEQSQQQPMNYAQPPAQAPQFYHHPQPQIPSNQYYGMMHHQQLPQIMHHPGLGYGYAPSTSTGAPRVLQMDSRAELRTTAAGAVVVPPPPPGCLPTPAQLAAMQGQQVVVQQKKRSFF